MHHIRRGLFKQWDIVSVWGHAGDSRLQRYGRLFRSRHRQPVGQLPALLRVPHRRLRRAGIRRGWQETQPCQFLRLSCDTPPQIVYSLMTAHWGVPSPNLVVSVVGGGGCEKVKTWVREVLRQGLVKAAQRTGETHIHTNRHTMVCCDGGWSEHS
ncbi:transient receptor potential cation channel subfamily M member 5-like isoform 4-T5 [Salvelinus alpinus]